MLWETRSRMRVAGEFGGRFWAAVGRQGCLPPLSLLLFNLLLKDVEKEMGKIKWGEVKK